MTEENPAWTGLGMAGCGKPQGLLPVGKGQAAAGLSAVFAEDEADEGVAEAFFAAAFFAGAAASFFAGAAAAFFAGAAASFFAGAAAFFAGAAAFFAGAAAFFVGAAASFFAGAAAAFFAGTAAFFAGTVFTVGLAAEAAFFAVAMTISLIKLQKNTQPVQRRSDSSKHRCGS